MDAEHVAPSAPNANAVCSLFDLGAPRAAMMPVAGGWTNRLWRLETTRGMFAVKEMNRDWAREDYIAWFDRAFGVELAAHQAGIPMPRPVPVPGTGRCLGELPGTREPPITVRVHEWVDAKPLQRVVYPGDTPVSVGRTIARIHALALDANVTMAAALRVFGSEHWWALTERVERSDVAWAWQFRWLVGVIEELEAYVETARALDEPLLLSHRDADQKNFMESPDGTLLLVDWDGAGPVHPRHEVASLALVWGGVHLGEPDRRSATALIEGYRAAGGEFEGARPSDLAEFASVSVGWVEFNVRRALGHRVRDDGDRAFADGVVRRGFKDLPRYARSLERWRRMMS